jgi:hypothetical protein
VTGTTDHPFRYRYECVKTAANYTNSACVFNKFTKKSKKIKFFGPTLLRHFLPKRSNFLGIFNILTGFYCM